MDDRTEVRDVTRVLAVAAHPDDLDFLAGGTIAGWTRAGLEVAICIVTNGDAGQLGQTPRDQVAAVRQAEARAAARELGVRDVTFLGYSDSRVEVTLALRRDIARQIRRVRPDLVLTWAPERTRDSIRSNHPDHRAVGEATLCAIYPDAANRFIHPELHDDEGFQPWRASQAWLMGAADPNAYVDITDNVDVRVAALRAHGSQTGHLDDLAQRVHETADKAALGAGLPAGRLAEVFQVIPTT
ncbi:N-acetylglucosaminyl deacetylase, LmbE family [Actinopolymorpha cephalotaxi]|uniref:LmbE family N-acetylglucosaminyl deacetylase n=1 Tax=Actinopolymorpha cephalotaxi TaxID=504797 RepID=A0A1I2KIS6_9ACTN|nr:PIG-L deacetylase family protein [Actinopolymorpha cephalotaxi]NYH87343.1 LmbE family N-acetylglucosaminyl deacetylase [Actinopolymorpha cephalotaxi]SFF64856.1 N-acetylglucosaminyl deacetylase, LmbE family [Actinopolymorpha cephalotaxi]